MKFLIQSAAAAGLLTLAACGGNTPAENAAENIRDATENQADYLDQQAYNATNEVVEERIENQAEAVRDAGENRADAVEDRGAPNNVNGM